MNPSLGKLFEIAGKESRRILGLMSGTSLDGLDIALCRIEKSGINTRLFLEKFTTVPYEEGFRSEVAKVFTQTQVDLQLLTLLNAKIGRVHADLVLRTLGEWQVSPSEVDLIASHGQTVFHAPASKHRIAGYSNATLQIGDADHIAVHTGIITVSDFRQKHIAAGGEGAPLAVYGDYLLFSDETEDRILLNLGGIGNFTFLPRHEGAGDIFTTDTGPANTLIDTCARAYFNQPYDPEGQIARSGKKNEKLLDQLLKAPFFHLPYPKSTGQEIFHFDYVLQAQADTGTLSIAPADLIATLTDLTAETVCNAIRDNLPENSNTVIYVSGGGARNTYLIERIKQKLKDREIKPMDDLGVPGDAKEAVLFAVLANETVVATHPSIAVGKGLKAVSLGKISLPE